MKIICKKCKEEFKAITGHQKYCGACIKIRNNEMKENNNSINKKNYNKNNKERYKKLRDDDEYKKYMREYLQKYREKNKIKCKNYLFNYYSKNIDKVISRISTYSIINNKVNVNNQCKKCGSTLNLEIHHEIYPILINDIISAINSGKIYYLCRNCHYKLSRII